MATFTLISNFTPLTFLLLIFSSCTIPIISLNITDLLSSYPDLSDFSSFLTTTTVASDLSTRSSVTLLAVPNSFLRSPNFQSYPSLSLPDILRYHILLEYFSLPDLQSIPPSGKLVTTLFQTTGRAMANSGSVNITFDPISSTVQFHSPNSNATLISLIKTLPYNVSILSLNSLLIPENLDLMASEARPTLGLNITKALSDGHDFNVAAAMIGASGVVSEFEAAETGAGITLFIPTDMAFSNLPSSLKFPSLTADRKAAVLRYHVLHSYYPLGTLEAIVNPVYPTLATELNGAGSFTLNISRVNGSVAIGTGIVQASVTQTVFDQKPVAIFGVSKVLLPREFFGRNPIEMNNPPIDVSSTPPSPPVIVMSPENSPPMYLAPGLEVRSSAEAMVVLRMFIGLWCMGLCYSFF